ncbi:hypothetical protein MKZ38_008148 [Zalerion maritima]|uniref:Uncharacterized protein n=1 Tax=Zalerion maritima TaxID=339359 RepID=A0AAD5RHV5_9PEZI|nr:hypothetical protein MKZ38_008148 [Zalerion maritima]
MYRIENKVLFDTLQAKCPLAYGWVGFFTAFPESTDHKVDAAFNTAPRFMKSKRCVNDEGFSAAGAGRSWAWKELQTIGDFSPPRGTGNYVYGTRCMGLLYLRLWFAIGFAQYVKLWVRLFVLSSHAHTNLPAALEMLWFAPTGGRFHASATRAVQLIRPNPKVQGSGRGNWDTSVEFDEREG